MRSFGGVFSGQGLLTGREKWMLRGTFSISYRDRGKGTRWRLTSPWIEHTDVQSEERQAETGGLQKIIKLCRWPECIYIFLVLDCLIHMTLTASYSQVCSHSLWESSRLYCTLWVEDGSNITSLIHLLDWKMQQQKKKRIQSEAQTSSEHLGKSKQQLGVCSKLYSSERSAVFWLYKCAKWTERFAKMQRIIHALKTSPDTESGTMGT